MSVTIPDAGARRLLHRWLVEYNPLYIFSAALVLGGMLLLSRGLAREGSVYGPLGVAAIAELYAGALIGGAALLTRIGHRRPAVMLALLTALYQCDLTLHTETCPNLASVGELASAGWLALFVVKLRALAWAMKVRVERRAVVTAIAGALGLAASPYALHELAPRAGGALVALWLFGLSAANREGAVTSTIDVDAWGQTVLRRTTLAIWSLWGLLLGLHVLFWSAEGWVSLDAVAPAAPLALLRFVRRESRAWLVVATTLATVALFVPGAFAGSALLAAISLLLRSRHVAGVPEPVERPRDARGPYRASDDDAARSPIDVAETGDEPAFTPRGQAAVVRLVTGAVMCLYLAAWTAGWSGGAWPAHVLALDVLLAISVTLGVWRLRALVGVPPLAATWLHLGVETGLLAAALPRTTLAWGATAVGLGFSVLVGSLAVSYALTRASRRQGVGVASEARTAQSDAAT